MIKGKWETYPSWERAFDDFIMGKKARHSTDYFRFCKYVEEDVRSKILAKLAVEVMEVELQKSEDLYIQGHLHGVRRSIFLVKQLFNPNKNQKYE